jgi:hypothetical protein
MASLSSPEATTIEAKLDALYVRRDLLTNAIATLERYAQLKPKPVQLARKAVVLENRKAG